MKQRNIKFLLALLVSILGAEVSAATLVGQNSDGVSIYYNFINDTEVEVTHRGSSYTDFISYYGKVVLSDQITYKGKTYSVTRISYNAFRGCTGLTSVTIPNSVKIIGNNAFYGCSGLTNITISNSVTSIAFDAFSGCRGLTSVTIPNSVTIIESSAFSGCSSLKELTISPGTTTLAFTSSTSSDDIFSGCPIVTLTLGRDFTYKGSSPFENKTTIKSVLIGGNKTSIESSAFYGCSGLKSVTISNSVTSIGGSAFYGCSGLTNVTIPNSVTSIGYRAFYNCSGLTSVTIPNSVTSIGDDAFYGCSGLTNITIPNSVTSIGGSAFANCSSLSSMTIGTGVLSIGSGVFSGHKPTKVIWLPNTPPSGYSYASGGQNYVPNDQFKLLSNGVVYPFLSSMFEADGVKYVPVSMSDRTCDAIDCTYDPSIKNVTLGETVEYKGIKMNVNKICFALFYNNRYINNVTIWRTGNIPKSAFYGCSSLRTATLGDDVTGIGQYAFADCSAMTDIQIGSKVETIDQYAFRNCSAMTDIQIGSKVETIGQYAFRNCSKLTKVTIPQAVTKIDDYAFNGCTSLKDVYIADRNTVLTLGSNGSSSLFSSCPLDSVYIGGNIFYNASGSYGYSPFYGNTSLRTVVITDKETEISANEFYGCTNLQSFSVGDGLTTFGDRAFSGCSSLKSLSFGSQVQSIGQEAFSDCTSITEITSLAATPPVCGTNALDDINKWECTLHVPEGNKAAYLAADQWKDFLFMNEDSGSGETPHVDQNALVISEAGFATYCPTVDVDFTTLPDVKAYIASGFNRETGVVTMTRVYDVPAGTGLLVKGAAGNYEVPQSPSASIYSNLLRGSTIDRNLSATVGSYVNYVLGKIGDEVGFCLVPAEGMTLTAGRAYLTMPGETAASRSALNLRFDDEEEATGVSDVERQENGVSTVYDLQGRRVEQPRSGLYIRGGKKVIIK